MDPNKGQKPGQQRREPSTELLGPYALVAEIAQGDLTTVHLAQKQGALGFQRLAAIKRLKPTFARQPECVQLLLDEAHLTSGLHHANLVGVLDVGSDAGCYVVMDYIEGASFDTLLERAGKDRHPRYILPIVVDALNGLYAVHTALDDDGAPLGTVHQAPRARHILVGVDGTARITDFTQARARGVRPSRLRSERLPVSHMAPEQALNPEKVDHRSDLFIAGITLWEALTGERLFLSDTDEQTFQNLLHRRIPRPSDVGLRPPRCFDAVCLRALERDVSARYPSALEMARDLRDAALNQALYATAGEIGNWVKTLAGRELLERRRLSGSDSPSQELLLERKSDSGFFEAQRGGGDPYGSGRIYGGSYSMITLDDNARTDPDKTPALGLRGRGSVPPFVDEEPTSPRAPAAVMNDVPSDPPVRDRRTLPYGPEGDAAEASALTSSSSLALGEEHTNPTAFVPARPGARRDPGTPSPGAYSQISDETRKSERKRPRSTNPGPAAAPRRSGPGPLGMGQTAVSSGGQGSTSAVANGAEAPARTSASRPPPAAAAAAPSPSISPPGNGGPAPKRASAAPKGLPPPARGTVGPLGMGLPPPSRVPGPLAAGGTAPRANASEGARAGDRASSFDEVDTNRFSSVPARASGERSDSHVAPRPSAPPASASAKRAPQVTEAPTAHIQRRDSTPTRRSIPDGPVGMPHLGMQPASTPSSDAPPLPKALDTLAGRARTADVLSLPAEINSLTPPSTATRTLPPELTQESRRRSVGVWVVSGVLASIIVMAAGVGFRQWSTQGGQTPTSAPTLEVREKVSNGAARPAQAPAAPQPAPAAAPVPAGSEASGDSAPEKVSGSQAGARPVKPGPAAAAAAGSAGKGQGTPSLSAKAAAPVKPATAKLARTAAPAEAAPVGSAPKPAAKPAPAAKPKPANPQSAIPDNPY